MWSTVSEILSDLVVAYSSIKHYFSIINPSFHPTLPLLSTEIISCLQSLSPLEAISESQTFISPVGGMDCPPLTVCRALSLSIFFSLKVFYTDVIFHSSCSGCYLKTHRLQGQSRHKHLYRMAGNKLPLKRGVK